MPKFVKVLMAIAGTLMILASCVGIIACIMQFSYEIRNSGILHSFSSTSFVNNTDWMIKLPMFFALCLVALVVGLLLSVYQRFSLNKMLEK